MYNRFDRYSRFQLTSNQTEKLLFGTPGMSEVSDACWEEGVIHV